MVVLVEFSSPFYECRMAHTLPFCRMLAVWLWKTPLHEAIYKCYSLLCFDDTSSTETKIPYTWVNKHNSLLSACFFLGFAPG